jgi:hypothetical protein
MSRVIEAVTAARASSAVPNNFLRERSSRHRVFEGGQVLFDERRAPAPS